MTSETNGQNVNQQAEAAPKEQAPVKKKISVVFKPQNSSSMKELPKGLKNAMRGGKTQKDGTEQRRGPRPLPAGTKPVKPAVYGSSDAAKRRAVQQTSVSAAPTQQAPAPAAPAQQAQPSTGSQPTASRQQSAAEQKPVRKESRPQQNGTSGAKTQQRPQGTAAQKTGEKTAQGTQRAQGDLRRPLEPHVRILRSYGESAVRGNDRTDHRTQGSGRPQGAGRPQGQGARTQGQGRTAGLGGRSFGQGRPGSAGRSQGTGRGAAGAPSFDSSKNGKGTSGRGKNAPRRDARHEKKDKYRDELTAKTQKKGAFIRPEPKKEAPEDDIKVITIPETLTIRDLSDKLKLQPSVIIKKLFLKGQMVTPNTDLSYEEAEEIAMEYDILCEKEQQVDVIAELLKEEEEDEKDMVPRSPVVCVMGHVDHGKTSLLDAIRHSDVTAHEAGGITQHIGASVVKVGDRSVTFLDTPGHEAFTAMRLRGAQATDIAVLVVAADDGVKPQTVEAISHAKSAGVEVVVAINKIDKPGANIDMVKKELAEHELLAEDWGGSTTMVPVSAKTGEGIRDLLDMLLLSADVLELKANPNRNARGLVIEAELDKGRGPVATVLVQKGTLKVGDNVACGACFGKVRAMLDDKGGRVKKAGPSVPVEILGLNDVPNAGEVFMAVESEKEARSIADAFIAEHKNKMLEETKQKMNLNDLFDEIKAGNIKELPIIIKADVQGSVEAVKQSLGKLSNEEVAVKVIHAAVGNINESDVSLASAANAIIIGFNVKPDSTAKSTAEHEKVDIRLYKVIYQAIDDLEAALTGMLAPVYEEKLLGRAIIRQIFKASGVGMIAGCYVTDGLVERGAKARVFRGEKQLFDGNIASLKRFKDEVKEVKTGFECGMVFENFGDLAEDDNVEIYKMVEVPRTPKKTAEAE